LDFFPPSPTYPFRLPCFLPPPPVVLIEVDFFFFSPGGFIRVPFNNLQGRRLCSFVGPRWFLVFLGLLGFLSSVVGDPGGPPLSLFLFASLPPESLDFKLERQRAGVGPEYSPPLSLKNLVEYPRLSLGSSRRKFVFFPPLRGPSQFCFWPQFFQVKKKAGV